MDLVIEELEPTGTVVDTDEVFTSLEESLSDLNFVLENISDELSLYDKIAENDSWDDESLGFVHDTILDRADGYGVELPEVISNLESFKQSPAKYSAESFKSFIASIWDSIKALFSKIAEYFSSLWDSSKRQVEKNSETLDKMSKKSEEYKKDPKKAEQRNANIAGGVEASASDDEIKKKAKEATKITHPAFRSRNHNSVKPDDFRTYLEAYINMVIASTDLNHSINLDYLNLNMKTNALLRGTKLPEHTDVWQVNKAIVNHFEAFTRALPADLSGVGEIDTKSTRAQQGLLFDKAFFFTKSLNPGSLYETHRFEYSERDGSKPRAIDPIPVKIYDTLVEGLTNNQKTMGKTIEDAAASAKKSIKIFNELDKLVQANVKAIEEGGGGPETTAMLRKVMQAAQMLNGLNKTVLMIVGTSTKDVTTLIHALDKWVVIEL